MKMQPPKVCVKLKTLVTRRTHQHNSEWRQHIASKANYFADSNVVNTQIPVLRPTKLLCTELTHVVQRQRNETHTFETEAEAEFSIDCEWATSIHTNDFICFCLCRTNTYTYSQVARSICMHCMMWWLMNLLFDADFNVCVSSVLPTMRTTKKRKLNRLTTKRVRGF